MKRRGKKGHTASGRPVVLGDRDHAALFLIGECRYLTASQVARALEWSEDRCRRRLGLLAEAGYLRVTLAGSRLPRLYSLGGAGLAVLRDRDPERADQIRLPGLIRLAGVAHHAAVADVRIYVTALCIARASAGRRTSRTCPPMCGSRGSDASPPDKSTLYDAQIASALVSFETAGTLARSSGFASLHLAPDALATVAVEGQHHRTAIEVDVGANESLATIDSKLKRYVEAFQRGLVDELWFVVAAGARRSGVLAERVRLAELDAVVRVIPHELVIRRPVEAPPPVVAALAVAPPLAEPELNPSKPTLTLGTSMPEPQHAAASARDRR